MSPCSRAALSAVVLSSLVVVAHPASAATTDTWSALTGPSATAWSDAGSWSSGVPADGSDLVFPAGPQLQHAMTDDLASLSVHSISVGASGYTVAPSSSSTTLGITGDVSGALAFTDFLTVTVSGDSTATGSLSAPAATVNATGSRPGLSVSARRGSFHGQLGDLVLGASPLPASTSTLAGSLRSLTSSGNLVLDDADRSTIVAGEVHLSGGTLSVSESAAPQPGGNVEGGAGGVLRTPGPVVLDGVGWGGGGFGSEPLALIHDTGAAKVQGTFAGYPQCSIVPEGSGVDAWIDYRYDLDGDGAHNDVVLIPHSAPGVAVATTCDPATGVHEVHQTSIGGHDLPVPSHPSTRPGIVVAAESGTYLEDGESTYDRLTVSPTGQLLAAGRLVVPGSAPGCDFSSYPPTRIHPSGTVGGHALWTYLTFGCSGAAAGSEPCWFACPAPVNGSQAVGWYVTDASGKVLARHVTTVRGNVGLAPTYVLADATHVIEPTSTGIFLVGLDGRRRLLSHLVQRQLVAYDRRHRTVWVIDRDHREALVSVRLDGRPGRRLDLGLSAVGNVGFFDVSTDGATAVVAFDPKKGREHLSVVTLTSGSIRTRTMPKGFFFTQDLAFTSDPHVVVYGVTGGGGFGARLELVDTRTGKRHAIEGTAGQITTWRIA